MENPRTDPRGLTIVFTGDGKGKTTAAVGTAVRALGHGFRVCMVFFLKGDDFVHGEIEALSSFPGVTIVTSGQKGWVSETAVCPEAREQTSRTLSFAEEAVLGGNYDLVVLDEASTAIELGLMDAGALVSIMKKKPYGTNVIITGRHAHPEVIEVADLVTEMVEVKHPFYKGISALRGIDY